MNILIIAPRYTDKKGTYYEYPLGLAYISAVLKSKGYNVTCLNLNNCAEDNKTAITTKIKENNINIVCSGGLSVHFHKIKEIFTIVQDYDNSIITVLGGGLLSSEPEIIFKELNTTYGVLNEGEVTVAELLDAIVSKRDMKEIDGVIFRQDGKIIINKQRKSIRNLDSIPFPDYEGFGVEEYLDSQLPGDDYYMYPLDNPRILPVISTRSCPFGCTFCYHPLGKEYRLNSLDYFFNWLDMLVEKYKINMVIILDELFSTDQKRMHEFAERMKPYNLKWLAQMRVDDVDEEILTKLKECGLFYISFGIESASDKVLHSMKKKLSISATDKALAIAKKLHIGIQGNLIFGDPIEDVETYNESLTWWRSHKEYQVNLGLIEPYPGTPVYEQAFKNGRIKDKLEFIKKSCPPINLTQMNEEQYLKMNSIIWNESQESRIFAEVNYSKHTGVSEYKGDLYEFQIICPHCSSEITYRNMHKRQGGIFKLGCKNCNQRFDLSPLEIFTNEYKELVPTIKKLKKIIKSQQSVALIPCIPEFKFIAALKQLMLSQWTDINFKYFLDSDPAKQGNAYHTGKVTDYSDKNHIKRIIEEGTIFIIPPTRFQHVSELIQNQLAELGVAKDNILIINEF